MKSLTVRVAHRFNIDRDLALTDASGNMGNISIDEPRTITIEGNVYSVYNATFTQLIEDSILINGENDELLAINEYRRNNAFKVYYNQNTNLLFATAPSEITKNFLRALETNFSEIVSLSTFDFDFQRIITLVNSTRGVTFNTEEDGVTKKRFSGDSVASNIEASTAIDDNAATFLIGKMDVLNRERTIGFTKAGTLLIYSSVNDINQEGNPYLYLASAIMGIITN